MDCTICNFLPTSGRHISKLYKSKTNWAHIDVCLPNCWTNRFNIWGKGKGRIIYSIEYYVNLITAYSNVCRSSNISNATKTRKGNCYDNAPMENFFSVLKREIYDGHIYQSRRELVRAIKNFIHYYNNDRIK